MIRVNASLIKDYITCPKRAWYRLHADEYELPAQEFPYLTVGTIVHEAIAGFYHNRSKAIDFVEINSAISALSETYYLKALEMLKNFFEIKEELNLDLALAKLEESFEYEDKKHGIVFTGRFDCILNNSVYDWKTSTSLPKNVDFDPQFIIYDRAIERITGKQHNLYYVYLKLKRVIKYSRNPSVTKLFFDDILESFKQSVKKNTFERRGLFDYNDVCRSCPFKEICFKEASIEMPKEVIPKMSLF